MQDIHEWTVTAVIVGVFVVGLVRYAYWRWQESVERERFVLAMKAASTPDLLDPSERARLRLLRSPWWAVWRWLPERH